MKRTMQLFGPVATVLLFFSSLVHGDTWTANKRLTKNLGDSGSPAIAANGPNLYVVWADNTPGNQEIFFKRSIDAGFTWEANKRLTNNPGVSGAPAIGVDASNIHVVWMDDTPGNYEIFFKRSMDGGVTWEASRRLTSNPGTSVNPTIAVDGSNAYVVWQDTTPGNYEIYFKRSVDGGDSWTASKRLTDNPGHSWHPAIAANGATIYVFWYDDISGDAGVYLRRSFDGGETWSANKRLTINAAGSWHQAIAVEGANVYLVVEDYASGNAELYFKRSADEGGTWSASKRLTKSDGHSWYPAIAVSDANIQVVWWDTTPGNDEIFFKRSADKGATWTASKRLTNNEGNSRSPAVAAGGANIYVVWEDNTRDGHEIYFKKATVD